MLGKVIKYEFKEMKFILVAAAIGLAAITVIALCLEAIPVWIFGSNAANTNALAMFLINLIFLGYLFIRIASGIGMYVYMGFRFYKTMYSGIGYFTNALPIKRNELILGKVITAVIIQSIVTAMIFASGALISFGFVVSQDGFGDLMLYIARLTGGIANGYIIGNYGILLGVFFIAVTSITHIISITMLLFLSTSLGQLFNSNRILMSIIAFIALNRVFSAIDAIINFMAIILSGDNYIHIVSITNVITMILTMARNIIIAMIAYTISHYILRSKLNLE